MFSLLEVIVLSDILNSPMGAIHFGLLFTSCDRHVTEILAGQVSAKKKAQEN